MNELWKDIEGYEGLYQVSTTGKVRSLDRVGGSGRRYKGMTLNNTVNPKGYASVMLSKNNIKRRFEIHRLVAKTFIDKVEEKKCVNHIDGVKLNNDVSNLEWCTQSENIQHAYDTGLITNGKQMGVKVTNDLTGEIIHFASLVKVGLFFGYSTSWAKMKRRVLGNTFKYNHFIVEVVA